MRSPSFSPGSAEPRWATPGTPGRPNLLAKVEYTAAALGFVVPGHGSLMPHQRSIISVGTERLDDGLPAFRQVTIEEPRQQGKSVSVLSLMTTWGLSAPGMMISYSAQTRMAGRRRMLDAWYPRIQRSRALRRIIDVRRQLGAEAFLFKNGSMIMLASGTSTSDHGDTLDRAVIDEAWAQRDDTIEQAVKPAMMTRDGAQLWIVSAAGTEFSAYFRGKVDDGRAMAELGATDTAAYFGYSAPDDADPEDPATWYACMPALGLTVSEDTVRADFQTMELAEFRRAYLCQWPEIAKPGWDVISEQAWAAAGG